MELKTIKQLSEELGRSIVSLDSWARYHLIKEDHTETIGGKLTRLFDPTPFYARFADKCPTEPEQIDIPEECLDEQIQELHHQQTADYMVPPLTPEIIAAYLTVFDVGGTQNILINNYGLRPWEEK